MDFRISDPTYMWIPALVFLIASLTLMLFSRQILLSQSRLVKKIFGINYVNRIDKINRRMSFPGILFLVISIIFWFLYLTNLP